MSQSDKVPRRIESVRRAAESGALDDAERLCRELIDGCPAGLQIDLEDIQGELDRRKPGQSKITTQRKESDTAKIQSGIFEGKTTGTAISIMVDNQDARPQAYDHLKEIYRPSHADFTYDQKFGFRNWQGGGRASARETIGRVAAGAIARKLLQQLGGIETLAWVEQIHDLRTNMDSASVTLEQIEASMVRCPDQEITEQMIACIDEARMSGDSVGGLIRAQVRNAPPGLGEPVFDKLTADLAKAMMSLPATRGVEFGLGFDSVLMRGSEHNDRFHTEDGRIRTDTNRSGGIQGGISNGEAIDLRVAFKPTATINFAQDTVTREGESTELRAKGRHDPCVLPRAVPMVEAMINLVLLDHWLRNRNKKLADLAELIL